MARKQSNDILILNILKKYSDKNHILTAKQIAEFIESEYGILIERRTIYTTVSLLVEVYGYNIETYKENNKGCYLKQREFDKSEIELLCNSIYSSSHISEEDTKKLIKKLCESQSIYDRDEFTSNIYLSNGNKHNSQMFFSNIEFIKNAISKNKKIEFEYLKYNINKQLVTNGKTYKVSPYHIVESENNFYLICFNEYRNSINHYRLDKITNMEIIDERQDSASINFNPYEYVKNQVYMYAGKIETFKVVCDNEILDQVIERFSTDTIIEYKDAHSFTATINSSVDGIVYWAFQFINYCTVIEPQYVTDEIRKTLFKATNKYIN